MIGTGLYAFYKVHPGILPDGVRADYVFPFFIVNELPVGLTGLLIASIFAAGMSTIATSVTSSSTIILTDYYQRFRKHAGNRERMLVLKLSSVGVGVAGILVLLLYECAKCAGCLVGVGVYFQRRHVGTVSIGVYFEEGT